MPAAISNKFLYINKLKEASMKFKAIFRHLAIWPLLLAFITLPAAATESDTAKEQRWASQIIDSLLDGEAVWLADPGGHEFLSILTEGDTDSGRAVILMHGIGVHPNWPDVIYPLREGLLENGITSLSIQMPILENDAEDSDYKALFPEVPGRVQAAVDYLKKAGYAKIDIVAHSMGARMATYYLSRENTDGVNSAVLIGFGNSSNSSWPESIDALALLRVPVLDLYGSRDLDIVLGTVQERASSGAKNKSGIYRQIRVEGANHFFQGHEDELKSVVLDWLESS
jgi:pimeloyl-ACP methyl ester carboxylesterase